MCTILPRLAFWQETAGDVCRRRRRSLDCAPVSVCSFTLNVSQINSTLLSSCISPSSSSLSLQRLLLFVSSLILSILIYVGFIRSLAVTFSQEQSNIFRHCYCLLSSVFLFFSIHMYHPPFWLILSQCLKMTSEHTFSLCWKSLAAFLSAGGIALGWCRFCLWFLLLHWKLCLRTWGHCGCLYYHHLHKCMLGELDEEICQIPY